MLPIQNQGYLHLLLAMRHLREALIMHIGMRLILWFVVPDNLKYHSEWNLIIVHDQAREEKESRFKFCIIVIL